MRVIQYCRVSSDEQAEGTSLDYQERVLREYCARKGYEVVMCCREDYTAKHHDYRRPEMKKIRDYCKNESKKQFEAFDRFVFS
jgi:DNA invertase Pin-like site-specific DNA recombinase